jgi:ABC-type antimicrobial peptide transport system permease subunit
MILREAFGLIILGIALGAAGVLAAGSVVASTLYGVAPRDPLVLSVVSAGLAVAGLLAAYVPALRAASIEPMEALRTD